MEIAKEYAVCEDQLIRKKAEMEGYVGNDVRHLLTEYQVEFSLVETLREPDRKYSFLIHLILDMLAYSYIVLKVGGKAYDSNSMDNRHYSEKKYQGEMSFQLNACNSYAI